MADRYELTNLDAVKRQLGIDFTDLVDDAWLAEAVGSVSAMIETETGRWLAPRRAKTVVFDGAASDGYCIAVPRGIASVTSVGVATSDQPDDGSGTYTTVTDTPRIRGASDTLAAGTRIEFATAVLPTSGYSRIKVTGNFGEPRTPARVAELATLAVVRAFLARRDGGSADLAVTGMDGGRMILRRLSPAEIDELRRHYGSSRVRTGSVSVR